MGSTLRTRGQFKLTAIVLSIAMLASGCFYTTLVNHYTNSNGGAVPWWCRGSPDLTPAECHAFSVHVDGALMYAYPNFDLTTFMGTGATEIVDRPADIGVAYGTVSSSFTPNQPNVFLYDGSSPTSRLVGVAWAISGNEPTGFAGTRDVWTSVGSPGVWWLTAWVVPGYENHPNVFAASHPCLASGVTLTATTDQCFIDSHPIPLEILVTNDDGVKAEGIAEIVDGLAALNGVNVTVVAPGLNQSGSRGATSAGPLLSEDTTTLHGVPAKGVYTTLPAGGDPGVSATPADSVIHALNDLMLAPELIVSGINEGQNISTTLVPISGTVGAARRGGMFGIDEIATSQGAFTQPADFPAGVTATLALVEMVRLGEAGAPHQFVLSVNIPSCAPGSSIGGTVFTTVGEPTGRSVLTQDCTSTLPIGSVADDVDAFNHGFVGMVDVGFAS